jgi:hypothetical protein
MVECPGLRVGLCGDGEGVPEGRVHVRSRGEVVSLASMVMQACV